MVLVVKALVLEEPVQIGMHLMCHHSRVGERAIEARAMFLLELDLFVELEVAKTSDK